MLMANEHQMLGAHKEAIKLYEDVLRMNPEDEIALFNMAHCFEALGQEEEAIAFFRKFIDQSFSDQAWFHLSASYARRKDHKRRSGP